MLKRRIGNEIRLTSQPDHAAVSGYLAAHWGNADFQRPGYYTPSPDAEAIRAETVLAIAEHDNGWWEWEADPPLDPNDGLPLHLLALTHESGLDRWRRGRDRRAGRDGGSSSSTASTGPGGTGATCGTSRTRSRSCSTSGCSISIPASSRSSRETCGTRGAS